MVSKIASYIKIKYNAYAKHLKLVGPKHTLRRQVHALAPVTLEANEVFTIVMFSGHKELYEACACLFSFYRISEIKYPVYWIEDGTLTRSDKEFLKRTFINIEINDVQLSGREINSYLDKNGFPYLKKLRADLILGRKIVDLNYYLDNKWVLLLDSDVLFLNSSPELLQAIHDVNSGKKVNWLYNVDIRENYCCDKNQTGELLKIKMPDYFNSGLFLFHASRAHFKYLEAVNAAGLEVTHLYYWEQTLYAILAAVHGATPLPMNYDVHFRAFAKGSTESLSAESRHYCSDSRQYLYTHFTDRIFANLVKKP